MRSSSYWFLGMLVVFVIIGLAMGLGLAVVVGPWTYAPLHGFLQRVVTVVVWFGCPALCIALWYQVAVWIEKRSRMKQRAEKAKAKAERPKPRKRRKKQQF